MSAEILRKAASLMRERAEAATPGPAARTCECPKCSSRRVETAWIAMSATDADSLRCLSCDHRWAGEVGIAYGPGWTIAQADAAHPHIASWHPDLAREVAAFLDFAAAYGDQPSPQSPTVQFAVSIARVYLGEPA